MSYEADGLFIKHDYEGQPRHLGGHGFMTNMDTGVLEFLIERFDIKDFIDLGCGEGGMVRAARDRCIPAMGIDGDEESGADLIIDFAMPIPETYQWDDEMPDVETSALLSPFARPQLVWSVEFVEHVAEEYIPNYLPVFECGDVVFLSHGLPGQFGHHHVNLQENSYWVGVMASIGMVLDQEATDKARQIATDQFCKKTGMVFVKAKKE